MGRLCWDNERNIRRPLSLVLCAQLHEPAPPGLQFLIREVCQERSHRILGLGSNRLNIQFVESAEDNQADVAGTGVL